ncbi:3031_t:CDS:2, partial [Entrophospora sp. SA101]
YVGKYKKFGRGRGQIANKKFFDRENITQNKSMILEFATYVFGSSMAGGFITGTSNVAWT